MKKHLASLFCLVGFLTFAAVMSAAPGVSAAKPGVSAAKPKPTPAQVRIYQCTVSHGADTGCASIPGVWNDWAGRITPPRWDPCFDGRRDSTTMIYGQPCGPMSPTIAQWCTLNYEHSVTGMPVACPRRR
jgi:hypothetical protein